MGVLKILIFSFFWFGCSAESNSREPLGFFQEEKSSSEYDSERKENLYYFYKKDGLIFGKIIGLDNPLEGSVLRTCGYCSTPPEILPGFDVIQNLKLDSGLYKGKMYDIYNRKWFDLNVYLSETNLLKLRIYAYLPLFGKNIRWKSGESSYLNWIKENSEKDLEKFPKDLYALTLGEKINGKLSLFSGIKMEEFQGSYGIWFTSDGLKVEGFREIGKDMETPGDTLLVFYKKK